MTIESGKNWSVNAEGIGIGYGSMGVGVRVALALAVGSWQLAIRRLPVN